MQHDTAKKIIKIFKNKIGEGLDAMDTPAGRFHPKLKVSDVHSEQSHLNWDIKDPWRHSRDKQELLEEGSALWGPDGIKGDWTTFKKLKGGPRREWT